MPTLRSRVKKTGFAPSVLSVRGLDELKSRPPHSSCEHIGKSNSPSQVDYSISLASSFGLSVLFRKRRRLQHARYGYIRCHATRIFTNRLLQARSFSPQRGHPRSCYHPLREDGPVVSDHVCLYSCSQKTSRATCVMAARQLTLT